MIAAIAPDSISVSTQGLADFRSRQLTGERSVIPDSTPQAAPNPDAGGKKFPQSQSQSQFQPQAQPQPPVEPIEPPLPPGAMFAAAVIAGQLSPTPRTVEEVYARIGCAWIPPESELQLRDLRI